MAKDEIIKARIESSLKKDFMEKHGKNSSKKIREFIIDDLKEDNRI